MKKPGFNPLSRPEILPCARPLSLRHPKASSLILMFHGFTGHPGELAYPAREFFRAGFDVRVPRLPGHGTGGDDMRRFDHQDRLEAAFSIFSEEEKNYENLFVFGHSAGALLAVILSAFRKPRKTILSAPALFLHSPFSALIPPLSFFFPEIDTNPGGGLRLFLRRLYWGSEEGAPLIFEDGRTEEEKEILKREYRHKLWLRQTASLFRLMKRTRKEIQKIRNPVICLEGGRDRLISGKTGDFLQKIPGLDPEIIRLPESRHMIFSDAERETAVREILKRLPSL